MLKVKVLGAVAAAATLAGLVFIGVQSGIRHRYGISDLLVLGAAWLVFAAGALLVRRLPVRIAVAAILIGGAAMELAAFSGPPHLSDDVFRYIWDGRVQGAGIDPYEYVPAAPQLAGFRDPALWPAHWSHWCVRPGTPDPDQPGTPLLPGCSRLNRPWVHTIYPPVAEAYFFAVDEVSPAGSGTRPMQAGAGLMALAVTGVLLAGLHKLGRDPRSAVLWAWCPTVAFEAGNDAHVDVLAAGLTVASLVVLARARTRGRAVAGGGLLGLAVATKLYPALAAPAIVRRRPAAVASAAVAAVAAVYLPHLLAVGGRVLGYLPGYLQEEGYGNGTRFALLQQALPQAWCAPAAVAIMAVTALIVMRYTDPLRPADGAVVMVGAALIVTSPAYPWYTEVAVALAALAGRAEWLPLGVAAYLPIFGKDIGLSYTKGIVAGYLVAAAVAVIVTMARVAAARRAGVARPATAAPAPAQVPAQPPEPAGPAAGAGVPLAGAGAGPVAMAHAGVGPVAMAHAGAGPAPTAHAGAGPVAMAHAGAGRARPVPAGGPARGGPSHSGPAGGSAAGGPAGHGRAGVALADPPLDDPLADVRLPGDPPPGDPPPDDPLAAERAAAAGPPGCHVAEVVLPCLDEAAALPDVLSRLPAGYRAIVVDNGSSDGSAEIARRLGAQVVYEPRRGFGAACHAGLRAASAEVVCFCDCDGSLDLAELPLVAGPVLAGEADLMLGRRRPRGIRAWPPHARIANVLLARRVRRATGVQVRDLGPMRAARREPLLALGLRDRRFGYPLEMVLTAAAAKWRIGETDVCYVPRTGRSKVTGTLAGTLRAVRDMRRAWKAATG